MQRCLFGKEWQELSEDLSRINHSDAHYVQDGQLVGRTGEIYRMIYQIIVKIVVKIMEQEDHLLVKDACRNMCENEIANHLYEEMELQIRSNCPRCSYRSMCVRMLQFIEKDVV